MTSALTSTQRSALERLIAQARSLLEDDLAAEAAGRYGIDADGTVADTSDLRLDTTQLKTRDELVEIVKYLCSEGNTGAEAVARLTREAVFTHLNRLVAIRIAEALGLLPPSLEDGRSSRGFRDFLELVPLLATDDTGGYWRYLQLCADELASDVPTLFNPRNPLLALAPSPNALDELTDVFADPTYSDLWVAPDCLGWVYQFFNTGEERRAMREASSAPRNSRELAVRNQFFTPRYVVDFLVQNSLGRRLMDADPASPLLDDLPLLIDAPSEAGEPIDLADVAVLDPACGSGHFLLAAYDVLERAWQHAGVDPENAAPSIVGSLWGIEIDPRCSQVAAAAIIFRARRSSPDDDLPRPNIICARALPANTSGLDQLATSLPRAQRALIESLTEALSDAPVLGPLLKLEERLATELRNAAYGGHGPIGSLADLLPADHLRALQDDVLAALDRIADATTSTPAERLLAAEADDAVRFLQAMQRRYDSVFMNPPFGEPVADTKPYLKTAYPWIPSRDYNLLTAFVGRGLELCKRSGYVGAITSRAGMFLKTFEGWREETLLGHQLVTLADLGYGVMEQAMVEAAAYVIGAEPAQRGHHATFIRLLKDTNRPARLATTIAVTRAGQPDPRVFTVTLDDLRAVPGSPVAYWTSPVIRRLFTDRPPLEGHGAEVRVGLQTGDDFRFVRAFWEVHPTRIARSREETYHGKRWVPFAKGGEYSPYWADIHLVVNYQNEGDELRGSAGSVIRNPRYYFRDGITWPERTTSGFGPRVLPAGCVFSHRGPSAFPAGSVWPLLGYLKSRLVDALVAVSLGSAEETRGGAAKLYAVGVLQKVPWHSRLGANNAIAQLTSICTRRRAEDDLSDETARRFMVPDTIKVRRRATGFDERVREAVARRTRRSLQILEASYDVEAIIHHAVGLDEDASDYLKKEVGSHPNEYKVDSVDSTEFRRLYTKSMDGLVDEALELRGGSRAIANLTFFADRRLEVLAHALERPPSQLVEFRDELDLLPPEEPAASAEEAFSYLVGCAFGRWDIRIGRDPSLALPLPDIFDPVPLCPPGMLVGEKGVPSDKAPPGYPLELPPEQLLVDEPGHAWDIEERVVATAGVLFDDQDSVLTELLKILQRGTVRDYIRKRFFKDHLSRYSKSRRKAPIYWPLYVPTGNWGAWVYAPALSRETLYAVAAAAAKRLESAGAEIRRLRNEREAGGSGRSVQAVADALVAEESLVEELREFRAEAERIASLGWEPDLDDGIVLCAAPLADLFLPWKEAAKERENLKAGKYPWASVAKWADEL